MGIINAQRTLNYIRTLTEFISQPEYSNVIPMFSFLNEARMADIGAPQMRSLCVPTACIRVDRTHPSHSYLAAYQMIRGVTGVGRGPMLAIHDGFADTTLWAGFIPGADRLALDTHPYMAFGGVNNDPISAKIPTVRLPLLLFRLAS